MDAPRPRTIPTRNGVLAISPDDCEHRIGVMADTENEAIEQWNAAYAQRLVILARPPYSQRITEDGRDPYDRCGTTIPPTETRSRP